MAILTWKYIWVLKYLNALDNKKKHIQHFFYFGKNGSGCTFCVRGKSSSALQQINQRILAAVLQQLESADTQNTPMKNNYDLS